MEKRKLNLEDYDFYLPEELIAQKPLKKRSDSRLLIVDREKGEFFEDKFYNIHKYLDKNDMLVFNNTRVIKARLFGKKKTGANIEVLLLRKKSDLLWEALVKPGKRMKIGDEVLFESGVLGKVIDIIEEGIRIIEFNDKFGFDFLEKYGNIPLPPYIKEKLEDSERYQTVYSKISNSAAAPTAGLHFDDEVFKKLDEKGIKREYITLGVGLGTFRPLSKSYIPDNKLHEEEYFISEKTAKNINSHKENGGNIVCVGTTSVRTLETNSLEYGRIKSGRGITDIFIYPGYEFKIVDKIITNFHLPKSSLLVMISAFAGYDLTMKAYEYAVKNEFRFFSFGDAMLII